MMLATSFAFGQSWDKAKGVGLSGSVTKFIGGNVDRAALGALGGISLRYGTTPHIMLDFNMGYGSFRPTKEGSRYAGDKHSAYQTFLLPFDLTAKITPFAESRFKPYAALGIGLLFWDLRDVSGTDVSLWGDHKLRWGNQVYDKTQSECTTFFGLGLETFLTSGIALDLLGGIHALTTKPNSDNVGLGDNNEASLEGRVTLSYYFGYFKDSDKDGIEDKNDADPKRPEDVDGFQDEDGAPDDDNDLDGIPDLRDKAPNEAEDKDGFQDEDGVPDPDNDNDGIADAVDKAPNQAEDVDGFQDTDGAPDADNDNDGIADNDDKCPGTDATVAKGQDTKETINDYQDADGCPDKKPVPVMEKKGAKLILKGVNFETGSAELTKDSFTVLNEVIEGLKDNKEVELEIRGYTDDRGAASANQKLSERRANTVMKYLIATGIAPERLKAAGYGEKDPITSNATEEGRAQNRRIEFVRTK